MVTKVTRNVDLIYKTSVYSQLSSGELQHTCVDNQLQHLLRLKSVESSGKTH